MMGNRKPEPIMDRSYEENVMKKGIVILALLIGMLIGSLLNQPVTGNALDVLDIKFIQTRGYCFATFGDSITFVKNSPNWNDCMNINR
ncbi:MAG: hypothetical protein ACE5GQ_08995 [Nitrospinales bacterium]